MHWIQVQAIHPTNPWWGTPLPHPPLHPVSFSPLLVLLWGQILWARELWKIYQEIICLYVVILVQRNEQSSSARTMSGSPSNMLVREGIIPRFWGCTELDMMVSCSVAQVFNTTCTVNNSGVWGLRLSNYFCCGWYFLVLGTLSQGWGAPVKFWALLGCSWILGDTLLSFLLDPKYRQAHPTIAQGRDQLHAGACRAWGVLWEGRWVQRSESTEAGWRQLLPRAAQSCRNIHHIPLPVLCGPRPLQSSAARGTPCTRMYQPLVQPATGPHPAPPFLRTLGFCLSGRSVLGFAPTTEGLVRAKPHNSAVAPSGMAGLQQFWLKKGWKIKESGRG